MSQRHRVERYTELRPDSDRQHGKRLPGLMSVRPSCSFSQLSFLARSCVVRLGLTMELLTMSV